MKNNYEVIIVGGGPAGISAGIYCLRAGVKALVLDADKSTLEEAKSIQNYYGIENISGKELKEKGVKQLLSLGGEVLNEEVLKISQNFSDNTFNVKTINYEYKTKAVILCTGTAKKKTIAGLENFENVSYCAICDGFFYSGKTIAVVGEGKFALSECEELERVVDKIYLLTNGENVKVNNPKIEVINKKVKTYRGEKRVKEVEFEDSSKINVDGVFVASGSLSSFEISKQLGLITKNNFIVVDKNFLTNINGVFAAGDVIGGLLQVCKAVSDGAQAGLEAVRYLKIMEFKE